MSLFRLSFLAPLFVGVIALTGCESYEPGEAPTASDNTQSIHQLLGNKNRKTIFGDGGVSLFGDNEQGGSPDGGVNVFLWRASLDTVSFMPVNSADVFGGVILTDWHSSAEAPNERFKLNVYILGRTLRADGVRVAVFRQIFTRNGQWADAAVPVETKTQIEDSILTRARQLRNTALLQKKR